MSAAEFSPAAIPHSCTLQRVPSVLWAPGHSSTNPQQAAAACTQGRGRGALQLCAHPCRYSGACCDAGACFGSPLGPASAQAVLSPPFAALLASRVNHVLMLSPRSAEGAATLDPINKYTFHTALKPVIPLCMEGPTRDLVLIRGMLRAALPSLSGTGGATNDAPSPASCSSSPTAQPKQEMGGLSVPTTTPLLLRGSQRDQRPQPWPGSHRPLALAPLLPACGGVPGGCVLSRQRGFIFKQLAEILPAPPAEGRGGCAPGMRAALGPCCQRRGAVPTAMPCVERAERLPGTP